jgi:hypothetical protein
MQETISCIKVSEIKRKGKKEEDYEDKNLH